MSLPWTYSGLLDDVMQRYPISDQVTEDLFDRMILRNLFFSGGMLLNDGYLVNHPASRRELMRSESLLRYMISGNFIRILSREPNAEAFSDMPKRMAEQRNASFVSLVNSPDWSSLQAELKRLGANLFRTNNIKPWPNRMMHRGFVLLLDRIFDKSHADLGLTCDDLPLGELREEFHRLLGPEQASPRDRFEKAVQTVAKQRAADPAKATRELMNIANQAYHYNFGLCLRPEFTDPVAVDTSIGPAFEDLLALDDVYERVLERIPVIQIPKKLPFKTGKAFAELINLNTKLGQAKLDYLTALDGAFALQTDDREAFKDIEEAAQTYSRRLGEHFGEHTKRWLPDVFLDSAITVGFGTIVKAGGELAGEALKRVGFAPYAGMAADVAGENLNPKEFLLRKFRVRQLQQEFDPTHPALDPGAFHLFSARELRPQFASQAFNRAMADDFVKQVPPMRPAA